MTWYDRIYYVPFWWWAAAVVLAVAVILRCLYLMGFQVRQPRAMALSDDHTPAVIPQHHQAPTPLVRIDPPTPPMLEVIERETTTTVRERITRPAGPSRKDIAIW